MDCVVSFETLEHHDRHEQMMREVKRVLRPGGLLVISSPDKYWISDVPKLRNPFHVKELYRKEFAELLAAHFAHVAMAGQRVLHGSVLGGGSAPAGFRYWELTDGEVASTAETAQLARPLYNFALASDQSLPAIPASVLEQDILKSETAVALLREREVLRAELEHFYHSWSWRLTGPLRGCKRFAAAACRRKARA